MFKNIKKLTDKFEGSIYEKKMKDRPEFFGWLRRRVDNYFEKYNN